MLISKVIYIFKKQLKRVLVLSPRLWIKSILLMSQIKCLILSSQNYCNVYRCVWYFICHFPWVLYYLRYYFCICCLFFRNTFDFGTMFIPHLMYLSVIVNAFQSRENDQQSKQPGHLVHCAFVLHLPGLKPTQWTSATRECTPPPPTPS